MSLAVGGNVGSERRQWSTKAVSIQHSEDEGYAYLAEKSTRPTSTYKRNSNDLPIRRETR